MRILAFWVSILLVFTIPWENALTVGSLGTLTRVIGLASAGFWLLSVLLRGRLRKLHPFHIVIFLFVLWNTLSMLWSVAPDQTMVRIKTYAQLAMMCWMFWDLYKTPKELNVALQAYILGSFVTIASTINNYRTGQTINVYDVRYAGANLNAVEMAIILILGIPIAWSLANFLSKSWLSYLLKVTNLIFIPLAVFAIFLTATRTALFAILPAVLYILGTSNRIKLGWRILIFIVLIVGVVVLLPFIPQASLDRLATVGSSISAGDLGGRVRLWIESVAIFLKEPLLGVGSGALGSDFELGSYAHNTFLSILAELGILGFILFVVLLTIVLYEAVRQPKKNSILWLAVLAIWIAGTFSLTWEYTKQTWLILNWVVISANLMNPLRSGVVENQGNSPKPAVLADPSAQPKETYAQGLLSKS